MISAASRMLDSWSCGKPRNVHADMMAVTLEIVAQCLFGAEVAGVADRVGKAMQVVTDRFITDASQALLIPFDLPDFLAPARRDAISDLDKIINGIIRERSALHQRRGDLLDTLLHARDAEGQPMTDAQLRDEVMTLFLAGHETTAISLSWTCYLLSQHPPISSKNCMRFSVTANPCQKTFPVCATRKWCSKNPCGSIQPSGASGGKR